LQLYAGLASLYAHEESDAVITQRQSDITTVLESQPAKFAREILTGNVGGTQDLVRETLALLSNPQWELLPRGTHLSHGRFPPRSTTSPLIAVFRNAFRTVVGYMERPRPVCEIPFPEAFSTVFSFLVHDVRCLLLLPVKAVPLERCLYGRGHAPQMIPPN
jgi:hypothetical protein